MTLSKYATDVSSELFSFVLSLYISFQSLTWEAPLFILSEKVKGDTARGGQSLPWQKRPVELGLNIAGP